MKKRLRTRTDPDPTSSFCEFRIADSIWGGQIITDPEHWKKNKIGQSDREYVLKKANGRWALSPNLHGFF
jgi:hypothetical protein